MARFDGVRLRNGLGWVDLHRGTIRSPPDGEAFGVAEGAAPRCTLFSIVEAAGVPGGIAVLQTAGQPLLSEEACRATARLLLQAGFPVVAWIDLEAKAAAVVRCFAAEARALDEAACGVWALKALGGWDEADVMTFLVEHHPVDELEPSDRIHQAGWLSVRADWAGLRAPVGPQGWTIEVARAGGWSALVDEVARGASERAVILADVDWAMAFNDAYGHRAGDLVLARVQACLASVALRRGAQLFRVGGEEFALLVDGTTEAALALAEELRRAVEALHVPFAHPEVRTHGRVTISLGIAPAIVGADLRPRLEAAVDAAKRAGRNRTHVGP